MTLPEYLLQIEKRLDAATPGPWREAHKGDGHYNSRIAELDYVDVYAINEFDCNQCDRNAELIAHSPTDLRKLVAVVREYQKRMNDIDCECMLGDPVDTTWIRKKIEEVATEAAQIIGSVE